MEGSNMDETVRLPPFNLEDISALPVTGETWRGTFDGNDIRLSRISRKTPILVSGMRVCDGFAIAGDAGIVTIKLIAGFFPHLTRAGGRFAKWLIGNPSAWQWEDTALLIFPGQILKGKDGNPFGITVSQIDGKPQLGCYPLNEPLPSGSKIVLWDIPSINEQEED